MEGMLLGVFFLMSDEITLNVGMYSKFPLSQQAGNNFQESHDFFNVSMFRVKLRPSSVRVTEPASGCHVNVRRTRFFIFIFFFFIFIF